MDKKVLKELAGIVGKENLLTDPTDLVLYGYDATTSAEPCGPEAVALPGSAEEIAELVRLANRVPFCVVPRGAGTGLTGGALPVQGGLVVSTQRMNSILEIDFDNLQAIVQPGVVTEELEKKVEAAGFLYPPDPQSKETCTIGGNLAENAGGPRAVKYGVTRQSVLALQAVLPQGQLVRLGARTLKSVAGYDMLSLLVGSEGTLGIITEATLRLLPMPEAKSTLLAAFGSVESAARAVAATFKAGVLPRAIEFMDSSAISCVEQYQPVGLPKDASAVLVIEVDGSRTGVERSVARIDKVMQAEGASLVRVAADERESEALWQARRSVGPSLARLAPLKINEDIVVPLTKLPQAVSGIHAIAEKYGVKSATFGHAGDGNLHVNFLADPFDEDEVERAERAAVDLFELVISLSGSITGEHGVGTTKQAYLSLELSPEAVDAMLAVKQALDPKNIMNPGKIFPRQAQSCRER